MATTAPIKGERPKPRQVTKKGVLPPSDKEVVGDESAAARDASAHLSSSSARKMPQVASIPLLPLAQPSGAPATSAGPPLLPAIPVREGATVPGHAVENTALGEAESNIPARPASRDVLVPQTIEDHQVQVGGGPRPGQEDVGSNSHGRMPLPGWFPQQGPANQLQGFPGAFFGPFGPWGMLPGMDKAFPAGEGQPQRGGQEATPMDLATMMYFRALANSFPNGFPGAAGPSAGPQDAQDRSSSGGAK